MIKFSKKHPGETIRALSWKQPYASLMLHGKVETRVWDSKYGGWVLICASKSPYSLLKIQEISGMDQLRRIMNYLPTGVMNQRMGVALAIGRLVASEKMLDNVNEYPHSNKTPIILSIENDCFVKYNPYLFMHFYTDVQPIVPFEWKGTQGWKTLDQETIDKIIIL